MKITANTLISEVVTHNYLTAEVFRNNDIDFCCNGNQTIENVCIDKKINYTKLIEELNKIVLSKEKPPLDFQSWPLNLLADYIQIRHHRYAEEKIPVLKNYLSKICDVHGYIHPELFEVKTIFELAAGELIMHMKKEELMLFPYIKKIHESIENKTSLSSAPFGSVQNPIESMKHEHITEGDYFKKISALTHNYTPPTDACNTYKVTLALLEEFEEDLHLHIHLENNILFPKAIEQEKELLK